MRAQDWSRFLPESSLSFSISLFLFLWFLVVLLLRFRDSPGTCACLVAPPIGQNPRILERETPRLGYPPLFSRGCSACGCAVVSGAASTTGVACSARGQVSVKLSSIVDIRTFVHRIFADFFHGINIIFLSFVILVFFKSVTSTTR